MSRGPGRIQKLVLKTIEANPDGAWTVDELCRLAYDYGGWWQPVDKKHRVAVARALRTMELPGTWQKAQLSRQGSAYCIYDPCNLESRIAFRSREMSWGARPFSNEEWKKRFPYQLKQEVDFVAQRQKYRDADEVGKLSMDIERAQQELRLFRMLGATADDLKPLIDDIAKMHSRLAAMKAERQGSVTCRPGTHLKNRQPKEQA